MYSTGYRVHERHSFLTSLLGATKPEEEESYANIVKLLIWTNTCIILFGAAEMGIYFAYAFKVHNFHYETFQKTQTQKTFQSMRVNGCCCYSVPSLEHHYSSSKDRKEDTRYDYINFSILLEVEEEI